MTREPDETAQNWLIRATKAHSEADADFKRHWDRLGLGQPIPPGKPFPIVDDPEYDAASERVTATEAEMNDAADAVYRERGF